MRWVAIALLVPLAMAGCSGDDGSGNAADADDALLDSLGNNTAQGLNRLPLPTFDADLVNGSAPLAVNFTFDGADPDGDALNWTLDVDGDGQAELNGTTLPASANHTYTAAGTFNATFTLSDGRLEARAVIAVDVTAAAAGYGPVQPPITLTGSATGASGVGAPGSTDHPFDVQPGQRLIHAAIAYGTACAGDIDWSLHDPTGAEKDSSASGAPDGEGPLETTDPAPGTWSIHTSAFSSVCESYTITVTFE